MRISVLGTGAIGGAFAEALLKAGHTVTVFNRSPDKVAHLVAAGARHCATADGAVAAAEATLVALTDGAALRSVLDGIGAATLAGAKILNVSTTRVSEIEEIARQGRLAGRGFCECRPRANPRRPRHVSFRQLRG